MSDDTNIHAAEADRRAQAIVALGQRLGWSAVGIADIALDHEATGYRAWIAAGHHGEMEYMARHGEKRWRPDELQPGTQSVISVALDYWPKDAADADATLQAPARAYVSRYALGRDYHKVLRHRLQSFAEHIGEEVASHRFRVFTDSAPVMEIPLAVKAGLGWRGKHTLLLNRERGSFYFLGEIYTSLQLTPTPAQTAHCGSCTACIDACPTQAIIAPHRLDARRCISYLTIEHPGSIPEALRAPIGNRIYGCDDCQLVCPWNKFAGTATVPDFAPRNGLDSAALVELFAWTEADFNERLQGSPIRRIGHERWLRNIAVALGNTLRQAHSDPDMHTLTSSLQQKLDHPSALVREHVAWALANGQENKRGD
ncbi:MAG: tRNA epoxyqueuosine(34) reductase QueG [Burkholderiales bacterium]|nr:tRNA epoxyqueuosine(34) reductase QueG [Burkholderiales bacterium]